MKRREFLAASASLCAATSVQADNASNAFLLQTPSLVQPVVIESVELLHGNGEYVVRVRSKEGVAVANSSRLRETEMRRWRCPPDPVWESPLTPVFWQDASKSNSRVANKPCLLHWLR